MILSNLSHSARIEPLHPLFKPLFDYVKSHDLLNAPLGKIVLQGEDLFINNVNPQGATREAQPLELHHAYIDVHIVLEGHETIGLKSSEKLVHYTQEYREEGDCALSDDKPHTYVDLLPGDFCIVYPEDAHAPAIAPGPFRKLIAKVRL